MSKAGAARQLGCWRMMQTKPPIGTFRTAHQLQAVTTEAACAPPAFSFPGRQLAPLARCTRSGVPILVKREPDCLTVVQARIDSVLCQALGHRHRAQLRRHLQQRVAADLRGKPGRGFGATWHGWLKEGRAGTGMCRARPAGTLTCSRGAIHGLSQPLKPSRQPDLRDHRQQRRRLVKVLVCKRGGAGGAQGSV